MDEFELIVLIFKGIFWVIRAVFRLAFAIVKGIFLLLTYPFRSRKADGEKKPAAAKKAPKKQAQATLSKRLDNLDDLLQRVKLLDVEALREQAMARASTQRFVVTLDAMKERIDRIGTLLRRSGMTRPDATRAIAREEALRKMVEFMVAERAGELSGLIADTDALANASYAPIVKFCGDRGIPLSSDRAGTVIDGNKLFFMSVDDPTGLTAIVLPSEFSTSIMTWPAIAHEIGHDFFNSVKGLPRELQTKLRLGNDTSLLAPTGTRADIAAIPEHAVAAWMQELFADAFGTMMLGPAYIETMMASFQSPSDPGLACAAQPLADRNEYEEHPPGHVRVVAGCRLLAQMGYGKEADALEARWRKLHGGLTNVFVPLTDRRWLRLEEEPVLARASEVGSTLYMEGLPSLRGQPLRSIAGLDFGPREHEVARRHAQRFKSGRPAEIRDARLLVAAAVLATVEAPKKADDIYVLARNAIENVDVPRDMMPSSSSSDALDANAMRDAFLFGELLAPPVSRR